jgi:hypothetical protein
VVSFGASVVGETEDLVSHFSQVKTKLRDQTVLKKALTKMGFTVVEGEEGTKVRGYFGDTQAAEFKVLTKTHYDIGFVRDEEGNYSLVGDWELMPRVSGISQEPFLADVKREYARESILQTAAQQGYEVKMQENVEGTIEMVVVQW